MQLNQFADPSLPLFRVAAPNWFSIIAQNPPNPNLISDPHGMQGEFQIFIIGIQLSSLCPSAQCYCFLFVLLSWAISIKNPQKTSHTHRCTPSSPPLQPYWKYFLGSKLWEKEIWPKPHPAACLGQLLLILSVIACILGASLRTAVKLHAEGLPKWSQGSILALKSKKLLTPEGC